MKLFGFSKILRLKYLRISCFLLVGSTGKILHLGMWDFFCGDVAHSFVGMWVILLCR
jgi:hypothetical protein